ncbi:hypothetical protein EJ06DRAFT_548793 [Trichodelitschia bisporula]|uniref:Uncharacterized protein n=1 Tax=Trichodelitschia bisporula TaxID=703511 RepID=A0A6G1HXW5_9PEZI|nr:hypothetical protein EJ06DRAFT_548793 [Trichodelitschia bisporula]
MAASSSYISTEESTPDAVDPTPHRVDGPSSLSAERLIKALEDMKPVSELIHHSATVIEHLDALGVKCALAGWLAVHLHIRYPKPSAVHPHLIELVAFLQPHELPSIVQRLMTAHPYTYRPAGMRGLGYFSGTFTAWIVIKRSGPSSYLEYLQFDYNELKEIYGIPILSVTRLLVGKMSCFATQSREIFERDDPRAAPTDDRKPRWKRLFMDILSIIAYMKRRDIMYDHDVPLPTAAKRLGERMGRSALAHFTSIGVPFVDDDPAQYYSGAGRAPAFDGSE